MEQENRFDHNFSSCSRTYSTICIYHSSADPNAVTEMLQVKPDRSFKVGDIIRIGKRATTSGWFLGTKDVIQSKDMRAHVLWLLDKLNSKKKELFTLLEFGYEMRIICFWESSSGDGGPILDRDFIKQLSEYPFDLDFDIWFD